ncbi:siderophore-interacting protein [Actinomadura sp. 21ATH]|uniref:siderophore-interacting protein n=1 Tax=Actinomadura sp. 21ATH TaxID=1735444 RepID=UPI0035C14DC1
MKVGDRIRNPLGGAFGKYRLETTVTDTAMVTPTMRRIRLVADEPIGFAYVPGQHVRVEIKDPRSVSGLLRPAETLRTYTIWDLDPGERAIELRAHLYEGDGIGLKWARAAAAGDREEGTGRWQGSSRTGSGRPAAAPRC